MTRRLFRFERRWAREVLSAFLPASAGGVRRPDDAVAFESAFEATRRLGHPLAALGLRVALWLAVSAPVWLGRRRRWARLDDAERGRVLGELLGHRLRVVAELTLLLKLCAAMAIFGAASVRERTGLDARRSASPAAEPLGESGEREIGESGEPAARASGDGRARDAAANVVALRRHPRASQVA